MDLISIAHAQEAAHTAAAASPNVAEMFGINFKLFLAQLINFGIVMLVLWKWVFPPVTKALTDRANRIEQSLKDAEAVAQDKEAFAVWKKTEIAKTKQEAAEIVAQARGEAGKVKEDILQKAKQEQEALIQRTRQQLATEQEQAIKQVKGQVAELVVQATETIIKEKLTSAKDQELIRQAVEKVKI